MANRLPILILAGDVFANRAPDPVLQQVEHFGNPTMTVNDAFKAVTRYWDRITHPEQIISSLPQAVAIMLDPADCGPAFLGLCQDIAGDAFDYPEAFFEPRIHGTFRGSGRTRASSQAAAAAFEEGQEAADHRRRRRALLARHGRARMTFAETAQSPGRRDHRRARLAAARPSEQCRADRRDRRASANALAADADVVLAIGTRLQDFTTGSWTVFGIRARGSSRINAARFDATKHRALAVVGDARVALSELWRGPRRLARAAGLDGPRAKEYAGWNGPWRSGDSKPTNAALPSYAQVVGAVNRIAAPSRPRADRGRRPAGRALQELEGEVHRHLRLRVRLLLHGLRDRRRLGRQDGRSRRATSSCSSATARI